MNWLIDECIVVENCLWGTLQNNDWILIIWRLQLKLYKLKDGSYQEKLIKGSAAKPIKGSATKPINGSAAKRWWDLIESGGQWATKLSDGQFLGCLQQVGDREAKGD